MQRQMIGLFLATTTNTNLFTSIAQQEQGKLAVNSKSVLGIELLQIKKSSVIDFPIAINTDNDKLKFYFMKFQQKESLWILQQQIKEELLKMPASSHKRKSLDLRHTLGANPQHQIIKSALKKMQSLNSIHLDSSRKRQASLTSTRIPDSSKTLILGNNVQEDKIKEKVPFKMEDKGKLKKKISKQESPKPFLKLKRGETLPADFSPTHFVTTRQRRGFNNPTTPQKTKQPLTIQQYQEIIEKQRLLIDKLQKIISSFGEE